jgi:type III secretion protein W
MSGRVGEAVVQPIQNKLVSDLPQGDEQGRWGAQTVVAQQPSLASLLDNAKEELTFAHSERAEKKKLEERSVEFDSDERIQKILEIQEMMDQLPDLDPRGVESFSAELRAADGRQALERARERFGDPSHAWAALGQAEQDARAEGRPEVADRIAEARKRLEAEEGPALKAMLNVAKAAKEASGGDPSQASQLRHAYKDAVGEARGPAAVYKRIMNDAGVEGFQERLRFLTRAAGDDLSAAGPSLEPARLAELIEDLSTLRIVATAHDRAEMAARRIERLMPGGGSGPTQIIEGLLPMLTDGPGAERHATGLPGKLGIPGDRLDVAILATREGREVLAQLPVQVFASDEVRQAALAGLRSAAEQLIMREEELGG